WAVAMAPASFGALANMLLVGNFGDGAVHAFDPSTGALVGQLTDAAGSPLLILGLWDLKVGPTGTTDLSNTLFFTAGPSDEMHGVFGKLEAAN
ncbi:MAG TPA: TIGR03118 family protein, partial [Polyangiaceae bacterium]